MATEVTIYVDRDASGAGDGSSWTDAYTSLETAQSTEAKDISLSTGSDEQYTFLCRSSSSSADTTSVSFSTSWVCDDSNGNYVKFKAYTGHEAVKTGWDSSRYRLSVTDDECIDITSYTSNEVALYIEGLQMERIYSSASYAWTVRMNAVPVSSFVYIYNCYINTNSSVLNGIGQYDVDFESYIWNTIISGTTNYGIGVSNGSIDILNSIVEGSGSTGISTSAGVTYNIQNNMVFNCSNDFSISGSGTLSNNASDDGDGTNPISPSGSDWDNEVNDYATGDFTLIPTGNCYHGGADNPGSGLYTTDMEGDSYNSGAYSVGVDEYIAGGNAPTGNLNGCLAGCLGGVL